MVTVHYDRYSADSQRTQPPGRLSPSLAGELRLKYAIREFLMDFAGLMNLAAAVASPFPTFPVLRFL